MDFIRLSKDCLQRLMSEVDDVADPASRRQIKFLAFVLIIVIIAASVMASMQLALLPRLSPVVFNILGAVMLLATAYILCLKGYYKLAAALSLAISIVVCLKNISVNGHNDLAYTYLIIPVLISTLFFSMRVALILTAVLLSSTLILTLNVFEYALGSHQIAALVTLFLISGLVLITAYHRNIVERDRQKKIRENEINLLALTENAYEGILVNKLGKHVFANKRMSQLLGHSVDEIKAIGVADLVPADDLQGVLRCFQRCLDGQTTQQQYETQLLSKNGEHIPVECSVAKTIWQGDPAVLIFTRDIRERKKAESHSKKLSSAIEQAADAVMIADRDGIIEYVNPAFEAITGYSAEEAIGKKSNLTKSHVQSNKFYKQLWQTLLNGEVFSKILINRRKDGSLYYEEKTITPLKDSNGKISHFISAGRNITQRVSSHKRLYHMTHHDTLTSLPNRSLFLQRLDKALTLAVTHSTKLGVLFLDLDRFKYINDSLGHEMGDRLLIELCSRLLQLKKDQDTVARFGGDEFVILLEQVATNASIQHFAENILALFNHPFKIEQREFFLSCSIGISVFPSGGKDALSLLKNADNAMYQAKAAGKNNFQFYRAEMSSVSEKKLTLETNLRRAIERNEFSIDYQPIVNLSDNNAISAEALLRWQHKDFGAVSPSEFIPLLEETGLIEKVGLWVIQSACKQANSWANSSNRRLQISINVSGRQLLNSQLIEAIIQSIQNSTLNPQLIVLEITESVLMQNVDEALPILDKLNQLGIKLAIDDFGTGYSSLSYLKRLPIHTLKIDQSFIKELIQNEDVASIVRATLALAKNLKLDVIAEGVETLEQMHLLQEMGCAKAQGFLFGKPVAGEKFIQSFIDPVSKQGMHLPVMST